MTKKILLADDSVTIRKVVELTLMEEDYELEAVADGREALAALDGGAPDLLVADIHMPEVGGLEVARESKKRYPEVPVLLLVGTFETFDPDDVTTCGAEDFMKKPFDSQELLKKVGLLLASSTTEAVEDSGADENEGAFEPAEPAAEADAAEAESVAESSEGQEEASSEIQTPSASPLSDGDVDRIARRVAELLAADVIREVAWEVVPDTAEIVIRERLRELESQVE